jgi:coproporphyrinogen III oxidase
MGLYAQHIFLIFFKHTIIKPVRVYSTHTKGNTMPEKNNPEAENFVAGFKKKALEVITGLNKATWQSKTWEHTGPAASDTEQIDYTYRHEVAVSRGTVFEKATVSEIFINWPKASKTLVDLKLAAESDAVRVLVLQIELFPASSLLPMGHFNLERFYAGKNILNANMDIFPAATPEEDIDALRKQMSAVAEKYGRNQWELSSGLAEQYNMGEWQHPLAARAGFQFKMVSLEDYFSIAREGAEAFFNGYMDMVNKLKGHHAGTADDGVKNEMRTHWLEYLLMKDGAVRMGQQKGHPFEAVRWMGLPPTLHY